MSSIEKFTHTDGEVFNLKKVKERIAEEAEMIGSYDISKAAKLKNFMVFMHKELQADPRVVTTLQDEDLSVYFRGLALLGNHALELDKITKPSTATKSGRKKLIDDLDEDFDAGWGDADDAVSSLPSKDKGA